MDRADHDIKGPEPRRCALFVLLVGEEVRGDWNTERRRQHVASGFVRSAGWPGYDAKIVANSVAPWLQVPRTVRLSHLAHREPAGGSALGPGFSGIALGVFGSPLIEVH